MSKQLEILKRNINVVGLISDELDEIVEPALQKVVDDSTNPLDNILMAAIYPTLVAELKAAVQKKIDELYASAK